VRVQENAGRAELSLLSKDAERVIRSRGRRAARQAPQRRGNALKIAADAEPRRGRMAAPSRSKSSARLWRPAVQLIQRS